MIKVYIIIVLQILFLGNAIAQTCSLAREGFEGSSNLNPPAGWQLLGSYIGNLAAHTDSTHAGFNTLDDILIVEPLTCPGQICFYWRASGASSNYDINIDWSDDNGSTWHNVHTISLNGSNSPITYQQSCVDLPENLYAAPFTGVLLRFHQSRRVTGSFYLDDICIDAGTCLINPTQFSYHLPNSCIQAGLPFSVEVCASDAAGYIATQYNGNIQLAHLSGAGSLSGTLTQPASGGCALFNDLVLSVSDSLHRLAATDGSLSGNSTAFTVGQQCPMVDTLRVMSYNLLNFPNGRNDCGVNVLISSRWDSLAIILSYVKPDIFMVCELQTEAGADSILNRALNINGETDYRRAAFVINQSPGGPLLNNMLFYNSTKMRLYRQSLLRTHQRDLSYYTMLLNDPGLSATNDSTFLDVFVGHLDAAGSDSLSRKRSADTLRRYIDSAFSARNVLFGGDFNFYRSTESGYLTLLSGTYPLYDPLASPGTWTANPAFQAVHTQSTRASSTTSMDCGALGGMDDRFDFILASAPIMTAAKHIGYIPGTYKALGNSGNLFNRSINDPLNNAALPAAVKNALFHSSDHLPVIMDLAVQYPSALLSLSTLEFNGFSSSKGNELHWTFRSEDESTVVFILEGSSDGIYFEELTQISAVAGEIAFSYCDKTTEALRYYRLKCKQGFKNLNSKVIAIAQHVRNADFLLYPNPANEQLNLVFEALPLGDELNISIYNSLGICLFKEKKAIQNVYNFDIATLPSGYYLLQISDANGVLKQGNFIKK